MGIGMFRRHYESDPESAHVEITPTGIPDGNEGGVVHIGDQPGTAPTPSVPDAPESDLGVDEETGQPDPAKVEGQEETPEANEQAASEDQNGDPLTTVDPVEHPPVNEALVEATEETGTPTGTPESTEVEETPAEAPVSVVPEPREDAPSRGASTATWQDYYTKVLGDDPGERSRDQLAFDYLGPKPE